MQFTSVLRISRRRSLRCSSHGSPGIALDSTSTALGTGNPDRPVTVAGWPTTVDSIIEPLPAGEVLELLEVWVGVRPR